jgi:hypothetical protein
MIRPVLFALLVGAIAATPSSADTSMSVVTDDTLGRFPNVEGSNLEGERFVLPSGFKGALNVVLVAFQREQQDDVDSWMPFLKTLGASGRDLRVYELPTLGRRYRMMRPIIDGGMRRGIPDRGVREATVTLYIDKTPFRESLQLRDENRIYALLVDRQGRVHWRAEGRFDERAGAELARRIEQSPGQTSRLDRRERAEHS